MRKVKVLLIAEIEIPGGEAYRDEITHKLDQVRESTQLSKEHGITLYQPMPHEVKELVDVHVTPLVGDA